MRFIGNQQYGLEEMSYRVSGKSLELENFEYLHYGSTERADFLPRIEVYSHSKSILARLARTFVKYIVFFLSVKK